MDDDEEDFDYTVCLDDQTAAFEAWLLAGLVLAALVLLSAAGLVVKLAAKSRKTI